MIGIERLREHIVGAFFDGFHSRFDRPVGGHENHRRHGRMFLHDLQHRQPILVGKFEISHDEIEPVVPDTLDRFTTILGPDRLMVHCLHGLHEHLGHALFVFGD